MLPSCASLHKEFTRFYCTQAITYLRECPSYDCDVVAEIFYNDEVNFLEEGEGGWWRVQSLGREKVGWMQRNLLSKTPPPASIYYIAVNKLPLRSSPRQEVVSRNLLAYGDKVQKIAESNGWWQVIAAKDRAIGWIPATLAAEALPEPTGSEEPEKAAVEQPDDIPTALPFPQASIHYVAAARLTLHLLPLTGSQVVRVLKINDKVEKIYQSGSVWMKVRYAETGAEGWTQARYLRDAPVTEKHQIVGGKRKPPRPSRSQTRPPQAPLSTETLEPEGM